MTTKRKMITLVFVLLASLSAATIVNTLVNVKDLGIRNAVEKANSIAESVRDGLTAHMVSETMDKSSLFLENMIRHQNVENLRVMRSKTVIEQFGNGSLDLYEYDDIEKRVLATGESVTKLHEGLEEAYMRVTIPYIATKYSSPNCLSCHTNATEGDVLGVISMVVSIEDVMQTGELITIRIVLISLLFLVFAIVVANRVIRPYVRLFDDLEEGISRAYRGDFSHRVTTSLSNDAAKVATRLNELSDIFKFKKTIELDADQETIYRRIAYIVTEHFGIKALVLMEADAESKRKWVVYQNEYSQFPEGLKEANANACRAFRIGAAVDSTEFHKVCDSCYSPDSLSLCVPYQISETRSLILHMRADSPNELQRIRSNMPIISNYIELATPVLQSRILLKILEESSLQDSLTGLYNRRFLDQYIDTILHEQSRSYAIIMFDIDFFKQVNDTYGHDVGDTVIKSLASTLRNHIKGADIAARFGGEEFVVILFDATAKNAFQIAEAIRTEFSSRNFTAGSETFKKTTSAGIAHAPTDTASPWQAIKFADVALYHSKNDGRNRTTVFDKSMFTEEEF